MSGSERLAEINGKEAAGAEKLVFSYYKSIAPLIESFPIVDVRILGSFGRNDASESSDLDSWIITSERLPLSVIANISDEEIKIKQNLAKQFNFPQLSRHRSTIIGKSDAYIYESAHSVRVGLPYSQNETYSLLEITSPQIDPTDIVVSLGEFKYYYDRATNDNYKKKFVNYALRDYLLFTKNLRLQKESELVNYIHNHYFDDYDRVWNDIDHYVDEIGNVVTEEQLTARDLAHGCMFTYGKVQWDLIDSLNDRERFFNWRTGREKKYGFTPSEILDFVNKVNSKIPTQHTPEYLEEIQKLLSDDVNNDFLVKFAEIHTEWLMVNSNSLIKLSIGNRTLQKKLFF